MKKGDVYKLKVDYKYGKLMPKVQEPDKEHYDDHPEIIPAGTLVEVDAFIQKPFERVDATWVKDADGIARLVETRTPGVYEEVEFKVKGQEEPFFWIGSHHDTLGDWISEHVELVGVQP